MRIDAHQHFWLYHPVKDSWIGSDMAVIQRDFLPNDLSGILKQNSIDGTVAVQASQSREETQFLVELSQVYKSIKGVVGWVDLRAEDIEEQLEAYAKIPVIKGFRHIIQAEEDPDFIMQPAFQRGIKALTTHGFTYDLLIRPQHFESTLASVAMHPNQRFVLDHSAKPDIKNKQFDQWEWFIAEIASYPHVCAKVSGLVTEANWYTWKSEDIQPILAHMTQAFGINRLLFGSDWPVMLLAASYEQWIAVLEEHFRDYTTTDLAGFWGGNASKFYNLT